MCARERGREAEKRDSYLLKQKFSYKQTNKKTKLKRAAKGLRGEIGIEEVEGMSIKWERLIEF